MSLSGSAGSSSNDGTQNQNQSGFTNTAGSYGNGPVNANQIQAALDAAQGIGQNGNPTTNAGFSKINAAADYGQSLNVAGEGQQAHTIQGDYAASGNPGFKTMMQSLNDTLKPQVDSGFEANGRGGSAANQFAVSSAVANAGAPLAFQNYTNERQIQNNAAAGAPTYSAGMLQPGQAQVNAGYTPVQNFIKSLSSVSPGTTGNYAQTGSNTGTIAGTNSSSGDTTSVGAKGK